MICRISLIIAFLSACSMPMDVSAQEDCFNGIDDDGDGFIDLNDPDGCECMMEEADLISNGDLEEFDNCPPWESNFDYATDWYNPSHGTPDYFNCDYMGGPVVPPTIPNPPGTGMAGFYYVPDSDPNYEYIAQCLESNLEPGNTYTLTFDLAGAPAHFNVVDTDYLPFGLFGTSNCPSTMSNHGCLGSSPDYSAIYEQELSLVPGSWMTYTFTFTVSSTYEGIAIGANCNYVFEDVDYYYFIDNISIEGPTTPDIDIPNIDIVSGNYCTGVTLAANPDTFDSYQWFINGVAVTGANGPQFQLPPDSSPVVELGVMHNGDCTFSDPLDITPLEPPQIDYSFDEILCFGETTTIDLTVEPPGMYSYEWNTGQESSSVQVGANTYTVTVTDDETGCSSEVTIEVNEPPPIVGTIDLIEAVDSSTGTGIALVGASGGMSEYSYVWSDGTIGELNDEVEPGYYQVTITDENGCQEVVDIQIPAPPINIELFSTNPLCADSCSGTAYPVVSGGILPYSYEWSTGSEDSLLTGICSGIYTLTVVDGFGSSVEQQVEIEPTEPMVLSASITAIRCSENGSIAVTVDSGGIAPFQFTWNNGQDSSVIEVSEAGTYSVTVTDSIGCQTVQTFDIDNNAPLDYELSVDSIQCDRLLGAVEVNVTDGPAPYNIEWSDGTGNFLNDSLSAGQYAFTITDSTGCSLSEQITLSPPPEIEIMASVDSIDCHGGFGGIALNASGGQSPYTYEWNHGSDSSVASEVTAGTYMVTVQDQNLCERIDTFSLDEPDPLSTAYSLNVQPPDCDQSNGEIVILTDTSQYAVQWSTGHSSTELDSLDAGQYAYTITDEQTCTLSDTITLTGSFDPNVQASIQSVGCRGDNDGKIDLTVQPGDSVDYSWSNNATTEDVGMLEPGAYEVTISDYNGCDTILDFTIEEGNEVVASASVDSADCFDDPFSIDLVAEGGSNPYSFDWNDGFEGAERVITEMGNYEVVISDAVGCTDTLAFVPDFPDPVMLDTLHVIQPDSVQNIKGEIEVFAEGGTPPYAFMWDNGQTGTKITDLPPGTYIVTVTDSNGCTDTLSVTLSDTSFLNYQMAKNNESCPGRCDGKVFIQVDATVTVSVRWPDGYVGNTREGLCAGSYEIVLETTAGLPLDTIRAEIQAPAPLNVDQSVHSESCVNADDGTIDLSVSGGTTPYDISWNQNVSGFHPEDLSPGPYVYTIIDSNGCGLEDTLKVDEVVPDSPNISTYPAICERKGLAVLEHPDDVEYLIAGQSVQDSIYLQAGTYSVEQKLGKDCIVEVDSLMIDENDISNIEIEAQQTTVQVGDSVWLSANIDNPPQSIESVLWISEGDTICAGSFPACSEILFFGDEEGTDRITLIARDTSGCEAIDLIDLRFEINRKVYIPNVFSPNNDGINDFWTVYAGRDGVIVKKMFIYNRWGGKVFEARDIPTDQPERGWNGQFRGERMEPAVFVYRVVIEFAHGEQLTKTGSVTLVR